MSTMNHAESNKQAAVEFLQLVVAGHIDEAYREYVEMEGKHHNPFFPAGMPALQKAMSDNQVQAPNKKLTVKHALADGDMVAVHSHLVVDPAEKGMTVVHLFRFDSGKIVEMWDCGQAIPSDSPNDDGAF